MERGSGGGVLGDEYPVLSVALATSLRATHVCCLFC